MSIRDEALALRVRGAIAADQRVSGLPVDARVTGGDVFLKGAVDTPQQADVIRFIAAGVTGVRHVDLSEVTVKGAAR